MNITKSADNFQPMLKESIDRFLCEYLKGSSDFSNITSIFSRLLQNLPDPSLEYVWFYSALNFYSSDFTSLHSLKQVLAVKDLFQLLVSCSSSCNVVKKVALLAPVIYELCHLVIDKKEVYEEVEGLLEGIVSYISIFCGSELEQDDRILDPNLNCCFIDLVRVWVVNKVGENCDFRENLRLFLPIVSDKVRDNVCVGCKVGQLAGVVMCEAFWLRLCLKFGLGSLRVELAKDLRDCAVQMIAGFRSHYFLDGILRMLLEPALPVSSLLGCGDEVCLRQIVYDAVLTVEYSFLIPRKEVQLPCKSLKNFAVRWLLVLDNALQSARDNNDQAKVTSYTNAFSKSRLPSELIKWVTCQTAMGGKMSTPNLSTPITLIKWLLIVDDLGVRVFDCDISKIHAKALICKSRVESELPIFMPNGKLNDYHFFHTNNETRRHDKVDDDLEMVDFVDTEFSASPGVMKPIAVGGTKKRKEGRNIEDKPPVKFFKCHFHENTTSDKFSPLGNDNGLSGGSEVENSASDEDMEDMKLESLIINSGL